VPLGFYIAATLMVLLAIATPLAAARESRSLLERRRLLWPGLLASASMATLISYPELRDWLQPDMWLVIALGLLAGAARGATMRMESDHVHAVVRLTGSRDGLVGAVLLAFAGAVQFAIEISLSAENPHETTSELIMALTSSYLLGRSLAAWRRAHQSDHIDLSS